jgi:hypothetical protein
MIVIDPDEVLARLPVDFLEEARKVNDALNACSDAAGRAKVLEKKGDLWRSIKACLAALSHGKCWYCEARDSRADNAVDHFRPKGRLADDDSHGGYWWLAFKPENYRFSCTYCNSRRIDAAGGTAGGKQDHFPIADERNRARRPSDPLSAESPILLDPCSAYDVSLLWFDETGQARENTAAIKLQPDDTYRVTASTELYHWDHGNALGDRRRCFARVLRQCDEGDRHLEQVHAGNAAAAEGYKAAFQEVIAMCSVAAEYSRASRCAVHGYTETSVTAKMAAQSW